MHQRLVNIVVMVALTAVICLPGMAQADYVQAWMENGYYQGTLQTWDTAEAFLLSDGNWTGTGLSFADTSWTATLVNPKYALATGPAHSGNFYFTTSATDLTGPFSFDWVLSNHGVIVGVQRSIYTPGGDWSYADLTANPPSENRFPAPLPPSLLLLGSALVGLGLLRRRKPTERLPLPL
ncbi:MAG: hypothetical protein A2139_05670 [Desulfobacca sp. RBG_16_60_12]|nr:MAG: hypothetical protein A2139_05670 [Desulfobacca sp. RBG_16_60_12]